jgi:hypothetical protein
MKMMMLLVLKIFFAIGMVWFLADAFYRIITMKGRNPTSWKFEAIADILCFLICLTFFIGLMLGW